MIGKVWIWFGQKEEEETVCVISLTFTCEEECLGGGGGEGFLITLKCALF